MRKNLVRLSEFEYAQLERAREELMKKGIASLPEIRPLCPHCGNQLNDFKVSYESAQPKNWHGKLKPFGSDNSAYALRATVLALRDITPFGRNVIYAGDVI